MFAYRPQPTYYSPRDKYLAALEQAKKAEQEYLAAEALELEELSLRRRLQELELRKQRVSYAPPTDRLSLLRLQLEGEERRKAAIDFRLGARREEEYQRLARKQAQTFYRPHRAYDHRQAPQAERPSASSAPLEDVLSALFGLTSNETDSPTKQPAPQVQEPLVAATKKILSSLFGTTVKVTSSTPTSTAPRQTVLFEQTKPDNGLQQPELSVDVLNRLCGGSCPQKAGTSLRSEEESKPQARHENNEIQDVLQAIFASIAGPQLHMPPTPTQGPSSSTNERATSDSKPTSTPASPKQTSDDLATNLLQSFFRNAAVPERRTPAASPPTDSKPTVDPISSLKEQLEARLNNEHTNEIKDTIQAIFASLAEPQVYPACSEPSSSSSKGKAKATNIVNPTSKDVVSSHQAVQNIAGAFRTLVSEFTFPSQLDFTPLPSPASSDTESSLASRLAYTSRNAPLRYYEQALSQLLTQLDEVESFGNEELRKERKDVVDQVEDALEELEREVEGRWKSRAAKEKKEKERVEGTPSTPALDLPVVVSEPIVPSDAPTVTPSFPPTSYTSTSLVSFPSISDSAEPAPFREESLSDSVIVETTQKEEAIDVEAAESTAASPEAIKGYDVELKEDPEAGSDWSEVEA